MAQLSPVREPDPEQIGAERLYASMGLSNDEYRLACEALGRRPNWTETGVFSVLWSEHCSYKTSKPVLRGFPTTGPRVLMGPGEGAGVVDIGDGKAIVFKIESHNHPSAVEPYQGAATGVGGIIRDIVSMGARPIALLDSLRFGPLDSDRVRWLFERVVAGIAGYGNSIGVPTVGGEAVFDASYAGNPLVNVMCVGVIDHERIQRGVARGVDNPVLYVGPPTGRDGIHGATFASEELDESSAAKRPSVQVGDPFMGKQVMEACLDLIGEGIVVGIQDMGAAGLTSSSAEMASKAGNGMELWLDEVPQREPDMTPYELMLSESQERMLVVVAPQDVERARAICAARGVPCVPVGWVRDDGRLRLVHEGDVVADMPVRALVDESPVYQKVAAVPDWRDTAQAADVAAAADAFWSDPAAALEAVLALPTVASKAWVYRQFDHMVGTGTYVLPGSDAAVVRVPGTQKAIAMTVDGNGRYVYLDPETGGELAVAEAARNLVCAGAEPLAITDNLNYGNPDKPEIFWQLDRSAAGIAAACRALGTPVVSGNVSLYNEHSGGAILPTPVIGMVGSIEDFAHLTRQAFRAAGDAVFVLGDTRNELHGGALAQALDLPLEGRPPSIDLEVERRLQEALLDAIRGGLIASAHDLSDGGLAVAVAESCIDGGLGASISLDLDLDLDLDQDQRSGADLGADQDEDRGSDVDPDPVLDPRLDGHGARRGYVALFSESASRAIVTCRPARADALAARFAASGVPCRRIGVVGGDALRIELDGVLLVDQPLDRLAAIWRGVIPERMRRHG